MYILQQVKRRSKLMVKEGSAAEEEMGIRKGPWTVDEDTLLFNYVSANGEGRWNSVARFAGLKRTGKSCRLRWLNYLRPNVRRGNITLQEQILILDLHSRWGNRWSKIAQHLPGRTDNEIKNYWRTRVIKQAKQLNCDVNSKQFRDAMRYVWMPRLLERIRAHPTQPIASTAYQHHNSPITLNPNEVSATANLSESSTEIHALSYSDHSDFPASHVSDLNFHGQQGNALAAAGDSHSLGLDSLWNHENMWIFQQHLYLCDPCDDL